MAVQYLGVVARRGRGRTPTPQPDAGGQPAIIAAGVWGVSAAAGLLLEALRQAPHVARQQNAPRRPASGERRGTAPQVSAM
ncbi:hypothetical protein E2C01_063484 [Portunus trituberculatus]|uniref:Uncharacterized protein n=1 Tax=Portunus trituberculatus TaxID=210409 RepID=A0A5B7HKL3_PORTR|nr:hypothetical protein [Portunus trituberculatus]